MQAVQNSDLRAGPVLLLRRLLLVHGRLVLHVTSARFLRFFLYKTLASMMVQIWFAFYSGFTAQVAEGTPSSKGAMSFLWPPGRQQACAPTRRSSEGQSVSEATEQSSLQSVSGCINRGIEST